MFSGYRYANYGVIEVAFSFSFSFFFSFFSEVIATPILWSASLSVQIDRPLVGFAIGEKKTSLGKISDFENFKIGVIQSLVFQFGLQKQMLKITLAVALPITLMTKFLTYLNLY